jgi:hypothetical protein
MNIPCP